MFTVSWDAVSGATGYTLWFVVDGNFENIFTIDLGDITTLSVPAWSGYSISLAVTASNAAGASGFSNIITLP